MPNPTAVMRIDVATVGTGTNDTSRTDGVPNQLVTLNWVGTGSPTTYLWRIWDYEGDQSSPSITNSTTSVATFTPAGGATGYGQSFGIELVIDQGLGTEVTSRRVYKIATFRENFLLPVYAEAADATASAQNNGSTIIAASTNNAGGNYRGWSPAQEAFIKQVEKQLGIINVIPSPPYVDGTTETRIGAVYLPAGNLNKLEAAMGSIAVGDQATLRIYQQSNNTLLTSLNLTGLLSTQSTTNVAIPTSGWYELRGLSNNSIGTALFAGVEFDVR